MRRRILIASVCLLVAGLIGAVAGRSWLVAQARTVVVLAAVLDVPWLDGPVRRVTPEPDVRQTTLAGVPTTVAHPESGGPWPAVVFITGADGAGRMDPRIQQLATALARGGFVAYIPDLPGMRTGTVTNETLAATTAFVRAAAERGESRHAKVAIVSISAGATLALVTAEQQELAGHVSVVAGIAPFTDMRRVVMLATTGYYPLAGGDLKRYETAPWMREALARSLLASLHEGSTPDAVVDVLTERVDSSEDPLAPFTEIPDVLLRDPAVAAVVHLLGNRDPERFDELYRALPDHVRTEVERYSPVAHADRLTMPVELASAPRDKYFPLEESERLVAAAPDARLTVTSTLDHAIPEASAGSLLDLARFDAYVVRVVHDAGA